MMQRKFQCLKHIKNEIEKPIKFQSQDAIIHN